MLGISHPRVALVALTALLTVLAALATHVLTIDSYPALHTFGYSVGTNTHYCSADLVNWHPSFTCEAAS